MKDVAPHEERRDEANHRFPVQEDCEVVGEGYSYCAHDGAEDPARIEESIVGYSLLPKWLKELREPPGGVKGDASVGE